MGIEWKWKMNEKGWALEKGCWVYLVEMKEKEEDAKACFKHSLFF